MKFHGRIAPGQVTDAHRPMQVIINAPAKLAGVTVKIWELDTFVRKGKTVKEGSGDDLLAEFTGDIVPGKKGTPGWRTFVVKDKKVLSEDPALARFRLQFGGADETYQIPIVGEKEEAEGRAYEIGFSMHVGGAQKFKTRAPCFYQPPTLQPSFIERLLLESTDWEEDEARSSEEVLRDQLVCLGTQKGEGLEARLDIVGFGAIDGNGRLVAAPDAKKPGPLPVRADRPLYFFIHPKPRQDAKLGPSRIPIAICTPLPADGKVVHERMDVADPFELRAMEVNPRGDKDKRLSAASSAPRRAGGAIDTSPMAGLIARSRARGKGVSE